MLNRYQRGYHPKEAFELMALGEALQALGTADEHRSELGQANGIALGELAQGTLAKAGRWELGLVAQGLPTSCRNHLRWCFQLQPRVTDPRVMARSVPLTQMTA